MKARTKKDKTQTTKQYWVKTFKLIKESGSGMSGLSDREIEKIIDLMRTTTMHRGAPAHGSYDNPNKRLVATMLRQVSPKTAIILYACAWSSNSDLAKAPQEREKRIVEWMLWTFLKPEVPSLLDKAIHNHSPLIQWYADDSVGSCLLEP